jgi:hypothetical protein
MIYRITEQEISYWILTNKGYVFMDFSFVKREKKISYYTLILNAIHN